VLAAAGPLTLCGAAWNQIQGGEARGLAARLALILVAIVLGIVAMALAEREAPVEFGESRGPRRGWLILTAPLVLHGILAFYVMRIGLPQIDCLTFQRDATENLLQGRDPYGTSHANIYVAEATRRLYAPGIVVNGRVQVGLQYPPVTFLSALPGYLLGDVRYGYVAAILVSALFLFALFPDERGLLLAAFVLLAPTTLLVEQNCWTEPLVWMLLCATVYAAVRRPRWLPLALGLFLASKQYNFLALPFAGYLIQPFSWKAYWKLLGLSLAIALATVLPFALWNFRALWHDLVLFHLAAPVRHDALSFVIPFPLYAKIGPLLLLGFMVWAVRRGTHHVAMFAAAYGLALMLFVSASKQAFLNYYFLIGQALLLTAVSLWPASGAQPPETEQS
jgi:hypothetical protein